MLLLLLLLLLQPLASCVSCWAEGCWTCPGLWSSPGRSPHAWWPRHWSFPPNRGQEDKLLVCKMCVILPPSGLILKILSPSHHPKAPYPLSKHERCGEPWEGRSSTAAMYKHKYLWIYRGTDLSTDTEPTKCKLTLIQGWFMNWPMVIRSLGSVFSNWMMSCLASEDVEWITIKHLNN